MWVVGLWSVSNGKSRWHSGFSSWRMGTEGQFFVRESSPLSVLIVRNNQGESRTEKSNKKVKVKAIVLRLLSFHVAIA